jgi:hypothetical protein
VSPSTGRWPPADRALAAHGSWDWLAFARQPDVWPEVMRAARPALFIGLAVLLFAFSAALAAWGTRPKAHSKPEISLITPPPSPTLNNTSADEPVLSAQASRSEPDSQPKITLVPPPHDVLRVKPPEVLEAEMKAEAAVETRREAEGIALEGITPIPVTDETIAILLSHPGDTPMLQEWRLLGMQTLLAGAIVAASATGAQIDGPVADAKDAKGSSDVKKEDSVADQLKALSKQIEALNSTIKTDFGKVGEDISAIRKDILATTNKVNAAQKDVETLKTEVDRLRKEIDALRNQVATGRVSNYPLAPGATGRVRLVNTFTTPVTILVNKRAYEVNPGETRMTDVLPAGTINYEVLGIQAARDTRLDANEILTINVYTRQ